MLFLHDFEFHFWNESTDIYEINTKYLSNALGNLLLQKTNGDPKIEAHPENSLCVLILQH